MLDAADPHVKFDRPGGASSYLFLNNAGTSGVVLIDAKGHRRLQALTDADGSTRIEQLDDEGRPGGGTKPPK